MKFFAAISLAAAGYLAAASPAESAPLGKRPGLVIHQQVVVRKSVLTLGDIASFVEGDPEYRDLLTALKSVPIGNAPPPRTKEIYLGVNVLEAIESKQLPKDSFGYSIPSSFSIERDGEVLTRAEVLQAVKTKVWSDAKLDLQIRDVEWANDQVVPTGTKNIDVEALGKPSGGKLPIRVEVKVDGEPAARFLATASVDDWREVPVIRRSLDRGMLVSPDDVELVRLNLFQQPADVIDDLNQLIGRRTRGRLEAGETVRKSMVDIPPVIPKGKRIAIVYARGGLRASASGVALDDGFEAGKIHVRNERSKKIVVGRVVGADEVDVSAD